MATASKKATPAASRRTISTTALTTAGEVNELTSGDKVQLTKGTDPQEMVTVIIPKQFILTRDDGSVTTFFAGTQEMGIDDAAHWFSRAQGVKVYDPSTH